MNAERPDLLWRVATPADLPFVAASWFESYRKGGRAPEVGFGIYKAGQGARISDLIAHQLTLIAYSHVAPDEICGWLSRDTTEPIAHYVYVKQAYRRRGIATMLCQAFNGIKQHTHETRVGKSFASRLGSVFNPYLLKGTE